MKQGDKVVYTGKLAPLEGKTGTVKIVGANKIFVSFEGIGAWNVMPENLKPAPNRFKSWATKHTEALTAIGMALCILVVWAAVIIMIGGKL